MIDKIKTLNSFVGGYIGYSFAVKINFQKTLAEYKVFDRGYEPKSTETVKLSKIKIANFLKTLNTIKITEWKERYSNPEIMDGTNWSVEININNNKKLISSGDNAFPGQWKTFCKSIQELLGKDFG